MLPALFLVKPVFPPPQVQSIPLGYSEINTIP